MQHPRAAVPRNADFMAVTTRRRVGHVAEQIVQAYRGANAHR
jgi:hypothetical protein